MGDTDVNLYALFHLYAGQFAGVAFRHHFGNQSIDTTSRELTPSEYDDARVEALDSFSAFETYMGALGGGFGGWYSTRPTAVRQAIHEHVKSYDPG